MHRRSRAARLAVAALGLSIVTSMLAVIPALAGDTRTIHIGSLNGSTVTDGVLTTPNMVSAGESFVVTVRVLNDGPQNINNVQLQIGLDQFPLVDESYSSNVAEFPAAFTGGTTVTDIIAGDDKCNPDPQPTTGPIVCNVGTLGKRKFFDATLLITTAVDLTSLPIKATVKVSENANDANNPGNSDTYAAEGVVSVDARDCTGIFGYLPAGQAKQIDTTGFLGTGCDQAIDLNVPAGQTTNDAVIFTKLIETSATPTTYCVAGATCFGDSFEISVNGGDEVNGYFEVTFVWNDLPDFFNINKAGVVHDGTVIDATKKFECSAKKTVDCWTESVVSGDTWTFTIRLDENGFIRGKG